MAINDDGWVGFLNGGGKHGANGTRLSRGRSTEKIMPTGSDRRCIPELTQIRRQPDLGEPNVRRTPSPCLSKPQSS